MEILKFDDIVVPQLRSAHRKMILNKAGTLLPCYSVFAYLMQLAIKDLKIALLLDCQVGSVPSSSPGVLQI